ncbi:MAG: DUF4491 family protein [Rectinemataceae bacterium]|jgi:hypothetical protein
MSLFGPLVGILSLFVIGLGFFWVIRAERSLGWRWWYVFMAAGLVLVLLSIFAASPLLSCILGIAGASLAWGSTELKAQAARVRLGWYPANPRPKRIPPLWRLFSRFVPPSL